MRRFLRFSMILNPIVLLSTRVTARPVLAPGNPSLQNPELNWFSFDEIVRVATLQDYNTRLVLMTTLILGLASGLIGSFLLLRKRSLMGDALSHATLPGIALAFVFMAAAGYSGKNLPGLLIGATISGIAGVALVAAVRNSSRIKDDTAMGLVLSVFFGGGVAILAMAQDLPGASAAGLENFIYGKTASMVTEDFLLLSGVALLVLIGSLLLLKEFQLLCFDEDYAKSLGWPVHFLDLLMMGLVTLVTVAGLQAVGLILIIAFLITPAAAARFWTENLKTMLWLAALIGALSGWFGAAISALLPRMPAGAIIVLTAAGLFLFSMIFGSARGVFKRSLEHFRLRRKIEQQNLLRAIHEIQEKTFKTRTGKPENNPVLFEEILKQRSWNRSNLQKSIRRAIRKKWIDSFDGKSLQLSKNGYSEAIRITRNHRLWEIYLITHADIAASHIDRDADSVEQVLNPETVRKLEKKLKMPEFLPTSQPAAQKGVSS